MVDRHDIDALLIGSLYGELSSADEARLQAHLESHPADRTALHGLERARNLVRESRILQVQLDPPQSVTALLMQEAARRAPRTPRAEDGWFQRFLRSFVAHPAMAAATMLVLVLGVAGTLYLRQGDKHLSSGTASAPVEQMAAGQPETVTAAPASPAIVQGDSTAQGGKDGFKVDLVDGESEGKGAGAKADEAPPRAAQAEPEKVAKESAPAADEPRAKTPPPADPKLRKSAPTAKPSARFESKAETAKQEPPEAPRSSGPNRVLEVGTPQRAPLDIADDAETKSADRNRDSGGGGFAGNAPSAPAPTPQAAPPADPKPAQSTSRNVEPPSGRVSRGSGAATSTPPAPTTIPASPPPPPPPARNDAAKDKAAVVKGQLEENRRDNASSELAWARDTHARVISQVRAGKCPDAARLALSLSQQAPAYYEANVLHDRELKDCVVYINAERDRAVERERMQRAKSAGKRTTNEPPKKAPAADTSKADVKASESSNK
jgi:hypothetical protein